MCDDAKSKQPMLKLPYGMTSRVVTEAEVRNAQKALLDNDLSDNDIRLIDAIISATITDSCERLPKRGVWCHQAVV